MVFFFSRCSSFRPICMAWFYVCEQKKIVSMINMDIVTVSLSRETEGPSLGLRRTRIEQNYSYAPES